MKNRFQLIILTIMLSIGACYYLFICNGPMERERVIALLIDPEVEIIPSQLNKTVSEILFIKRSSITGQDTTIRVKEINWINDAAKGRYSDWTSLCEPNYELNAILSNQDTIILGTIYCWSEGRFDFYTNNLGVRMTIESGIIDHAKRIGTVEIR